MSTVITQWQDQVRGKVLPKAALAPYVWFRVGGAADWLFLPDDAEDLAAALKAIPAEVPVTVLGVGSNVLIRDGGIEGVVIRLGKGFAGTEVLGGNRIRAGAALLDAQLAKVAAQEGIAGLEFFRGVPGTVGGACVMNAGCYNAETKDVLIEVEAITRTGERVTLSNADMGFSYRKAAAAKDGLIFISATFQGTADDLAAIAARMDEITARREASQPVREKTGGSTFKNPDGYKSWQLIDAAGWRGRGVGGAKFSDLHANFLINADNASAADLEATGEAARADVKAQAGIELEWEIKRLGRKI